MRLLDPLSLACLVAVSETGTIAGAARARNLATSAVSKRLQDLEIRLGVPLIDRGARGVSLTDAGRLLVRHAMNILDLYEHIETEIDGLRRGEAGDIRIVSITSALGGVLAGDLAAFERSHPKTRLRLREGWHVELVELIKRGVADLAVLADRNIPSSFEAFPYVDDPIWTVARLGHPLFVDVPSGQPVAFKDAVRHGVILMKGSTAIDRAALQAEQDRDDPARHIEVTRYESLRRLVESGMGVSFIRRSAVLPYRATHAIDGRPLSDSWAQHGLVVVRRRDTALTPAAQRLFDHLRVRSEIHLGGRPQDPTHTGSR